jgi:serine/threonine protein kinase
MYCRYCGSRNPEQSQFCKFCKKDISLPPENAESIINERGNSNIDISFGEKKPLKPFKGSGKVIGDRYTIERRLGEGAFGITYLARHIALDDLVALKELHKVDAKSLELFEREAKTMQKLEIKGVPQITDYFEENNKFFIVQEYIDGKTLSKILQERKGKISNEEGTWLLHQILEILKKIHSKSIIHRDIKPDNIMIRGDLLTGEVFLIDFGGVKEINLPTEKGTHLFTPGYAPYEQTIGEVNFKTDLFSTGISIAEAVTGVKAIKLRKSRKDIDFKIFGLLDEKLNYILYSLTREYDEDRLESVDVVLNIISEYDPDKNFIPNEEPLSSELPENIKEKESVVEETHIINNDPRDEIPPEKKPSAPGIFSNFKSKIYPLIWFVSSAILLAGVTGSKNRVIVYSLFIVYISGLFLLNRYKTVLSKLEKGVYWTGIGFVLFSFIIGILNVAKYQDIYFSEKYMQITSKIFFIVFILLFLYFLITKILNISSENIAQISFFRLLSKIDRSFLLYIVLGIIYFVAFSDDVDILSSSDKIKNNGFLITIFVSATFLWYYFSERISEFEKISYFVCITSSIILIFIEIKYYKKYPILLIISILLFIIISYLLEHKLKVKSKKSAGILLLLGRPFLIFVLFIIIHNEYYSFPEQEWAIAFAVLFFIIDLIRYIRKRLKEKKNELNDSNALPERFLFCPKCGTETSENWKFCTICGSNIYSNRKV